MTETEKLQELVENRLTALFEPYEKTGEMKDLHDELFSNLTEACRDLIAEGLSPEDAVVKEFDEAGDLTELLNELSVKKPVPTNEAEDSRPVFGKPTLVNEIIASLNAISRLEINYVSDPVHIAPSEDEYLHVKEYMTVKNEKYFAKESRENNTLTIQAGERPQLRWLTSFRNLRTRIEVELPESYNQALFVHLVSGSLAAEEIDELNKIEFATVSGSQKLGEISAQEFLATSVSGSLAASEVTAQRLEARSISGSIHLNEIMANNIELDTTSGSVQLNELTADTLTIKSTSGSIQLGEMKAKIAQITGSSASIELHEVTVSEKAQIYSQSGAIETHESSLHSLEVQNSSGSIQLYLESIESDMLLKNSSGSIRVKIEEDQNLAFEFELLTGSGNTQLKGLNTTFTTVEKHKLIGYVNRPQQAKIHAEAGSGSIQIEAE